jgi:hypothetical protein
MLVVKVVKFDVSRQSFFLWSRSHVKMSATGKTGERSSDYHLKEQDTR